MRVPPNQGTSIPTGPTEPQFPCVHIEDINTSSLHPIILDELLGCRFTFKHPPLGRFVVPQTEDSRTPTTQLAGGFPASLVAWDVIPQTYI